MALSPDLAPSRPMIPSPAENVADHYLRPADRTFPRDFKEPKPYVLPPQEWQIFVDRRERVTRQEVFEAEHTGNQWS